MLVLLCYVAGRVHQFFKQTQEREQAYRDGYNTATRSLFSLATRTTKYRPAEELAVPARALPKPPVAPLRGYASVQETNRSPLPARHRASGRRTPSAADTKRFENWPDLRKAA